MFVEILHTVPRLKTVLTVLPDYMVLIDLAIEKPVEQRGDFIGSYLPHRDPHLARQLDIDQRLLNTETDTTDLDEIGWIADAEQPHVQAVMLDRHDARRPQCVVEVDPSLGCTAHERVDVPRHEFVPADFQDQAYDDHPLPIGYGQTISQPYIVAVMTETLFLEPDMRVLEIGTGSGYQAAILAELVEEVYTVEIIEPLAEQSEERLARLGYDNVRVLRADGYFGWEEYAPFDAIIVTAAPPYVPPPLVEQLKTGGHMVLPVGVSYQELILITRTREGYETRKVFPVRFVPMTGEVQKKAPESP